MLAASGFVAWRAADLADRDRSRGVIRYFLFPVVAAATAGDALPTHWEPKMLALVSIAKMPKGLPLSMHLGTSCSPLRGNGDTLGLSGLERSWLTCDFFEGLPPAWWPCSSSFPPADAPV